MSGRWPSKSFLALALSWILSLAFFVWGSATPALDEIWRLRLELQAGHRATLGETELGLLERALVSHPEMADDWLDGEPLALLSAAPDGWLQAPGAVLLRGEGARDERALRLDVQAQSACLPLALELRCGAARLRLRCERAGPCELSLPGSDSPLCQLALSGPPGCPPEGPPGVRLALPEGP
jgi:hypothetical protein